jgi:hypothetical protein
MASRDARGRFTKAGSADELERSFQQLERECQDVPGDWTPDTEATRQARLAGYPDSAEPTAAEIQEQNMPDFMYEDDEPLEDVLNSPIAGEAMLTELPEEALADWEREILLTEARKNVGAIVQSASDGAKAQVKPRFRRWRKRR